MINKRTLCYVLIALLLIPLGLLAKSTRPADESKLAAAFRVLLETERVEPAIQAALPSIQAIAETDQGESIYPAVIYTDGSGDLNRPDLGVTSSGSGFSAARITLDQLSLLSQIDAVEFIHPGYIYHPMNDVAAGISGVTTLRTGQVNRTGYDGSNVLVCIIDTGIDWDHLDFRDPDTPQQSRILYIWDQTLTPQGAEQSPSEIINSYGVEYTQSDIEDELDGAPSGLVRTLDTNGHGTHVAGSVAGNGAASPDGQKYAGMAPEADILVVKAGNGTFYTSNLIDALAWAEAKAQALGMPVVVNMSLGGISGPNDGTSGYSLAVDDFSGAGQVVVLSAGNNGSDTIHISGTVAANSSTTIEFELNYVSSTDAQSGAFNDDFQFELWETGDDALTSTLTSPNGFQVTLNGEGTDMQATTDGTLYLVNESSASIGNGDRSIWFRVYDSDANYPPRETLWTLELSNPNPFPVPYHGWLTDDDIGTGHSVSLVDGDSDYTLGNTADRGIIVGSYAHRWRWTSNKGDHLNLPGTDRSDDLSLFSSKGRTRDERDKPDIAAPGQWLTSSLSSDSSPDSNTIVPNGFHRVNQGTSMSAPVVSGAVSLLLQQNPALTPEMILSLFEGSARIDTYTGSPWNPYWGYGKLDIYRAMVLAVNPNMASDQDILSTDDWTSGTTGVNATDISFAVKASAPYNGIIHHILYHPYMDLSLALPLEVEIWSDDGGQPGVPISRTTQISPSSLIPFSWNILTLDTPVTVSGGTDYHVVVRGPSGTLSICTDQYGAATGSHYSFDSSNWTAWPNRFRIRPLISRHGVQVSLDALADGLYRSASHSMTDSLFTQDLIPLQSPYSEDSRSVTDLPDGIVDWLLLQLHHTPDGAAVAAKSVFWGPEGNLISDDGGEEIVFLEAEDQQSYYISVKHRNHLPSVTANPRSLSLDTPTSLDLVTQSGAHYGTNAVKELDTGLFGLWGGDSQNDGTITTLDYVNWHNAYIQSETGYLSTDFNGDGQVDSQDFAIWQANALAGAKSSRP